VTKWDNRDNKISKRNKRKQQNQAYDFSKLQKKKKKRIHVSTNTENLEYKFLRPDTWFENDA
jgi:hypothetical protein